MALVARTRGVGRARGPGSQGRHGSVAVAAIRGGASHCVTTSGVFLHA